MTAALLPIIAGVVVVAQVTLGNALGRLGIVGTPDQTTTGTDVGASAGAGAAVGLSGALAQSDTQKAKQGAGK